MGVGLGFWVLRGPVHRILYVRTVHTVVHYLFLHPRTYYFLTVVFFAALPVRYGTSTIPYDTGTYVPRQITRTIRYVSRDPHG